MQRPERSRLAPVPMTALGEHLNGYLAVPEGDGPWPGVVLVHEVWGLGENARRHSDHLAELGYLTIAPDLYTEGGRRLCTRQTMAELQAGSGVAFTNLAAARQWLLARPDCTGKAGIIGFCMGGGFALMMADTFDVSSVNYGRVPDEQRLANACPVVGSYGRRDPSLQGAAETLATALTRYGIDYDIKEYPGASHAFMNEVTTDPPWYMRPLLRVVGIRPDPSASTDAWMRIDGFFSRHLR